MSFSTAHSAKSAMFSILSEAGAIPEHCLILGRQFQFLEVYPRDVHAPLQDVMQHASGHQEIPFCTDATGSGLVLGDLDPFPSQQVDDTGARSLPLRSVKPEDQELLPGRNLILRSRWMSFPLVMGCCRHIVCPPLTWGPI